MDITDTHYYTANHHSFSQSIIQVGFVLPEFWPCCVEKVSKLLHYFSALLLKSGSIRQTEFLFYLYSDRVRWQGLIIGSMCLVPVSKKYIEVSNMEWAIVYVYIKLNYILKWKQNKQGWVKKIQNKWENMYIHKNNNAIYLCTFNHCFHQIIISL